MNQDNTSHERLVYYRFPPRPFSRLIIYERIITAHHAHAACKEN